MSDVIYWKGKDIETLSRDELIEAVRFCKYVMDHKDRVDLERMNSTLAAMA